MAESGGALVPGAHRQGHRRGSFTSVAELIAAIEAYLVASNADPKPLMWTATADSILEKVRRGRVTLAQVTG